NNYFELRIYFLSSFWYCFIYRIYIQLIVHIHFWGCGSELVMVMFTYNFCISICTCCCISSIKVSNGRNGSCKEKGDISYYYCDYSLFSYIFWYGLFL